MKERIFDKIIVCKRELEVITFLQTGSNNFWEAYYSYNHRKQKIRDALTIVTWFNSTLKSLHAKQVFLEVPFIIKTTHAKNFLGGWNGYYWLNPGINATKANYECFTLHDAQMEMKAEQRKII